MGNQAAIYGQAEPADSANNDPKSEEAPDSQSGPLLLIYTQDAVYR
jgi:hypothetical protein